MSAATRLLAVELAAEVDLVVARQRARQVAQRLGYDGPDQVRLATAVSEIARNAVQYAGGGRVEFAVAGRALRVTVADRGPGIADVAAILDGRAANGPNGSGQGLVNARRLADELDVQSSAAGTVVTLVKALPERAPSDAAALAAAAAELARVAPESTVAELQRQNRELAVALAELRAREAQLAELNRELEETNRGVVALYAELDEKAEALRRVSDLKSRFLSNMSHEFRTPLNSILSLAGFLLDRADGPLTPEQEKQAMFIRRAAQSLAELVNDLLDLAKVEAGKVTVRSAEFAVADLFATLRGMMRPLATSDSVALSFDDGGVGRMVADEGKVSQILRNLVSNALKFTERGEVRVAATERPDATVVFAVVDTGIGIAPEDLGRIFDEFGQVESAVQRRVKGTGLGLPLSRRLAELLGGRITVRSTPGVGSAFFLALPRTFAGPIDGRPAAPAPETLGATVLVIDDDEIDRYVLRGLMPAGRFAVAEASNGADGLRLAVDRRPGAIFLDLVLPDLSGFEVLDRLKADPATRDVPVIVHTSKVLNDAEYARLAAGATAVLSKGAGGPRAAAAARVRDALAKAGLAAELDAAGGIREDTTHG